MSNSSQDAKVDLGDEPPSAQSVWHCVELCRLYADCAWVSWRGGAAVDGLDQIEPRKLTLKSKMHLTLRCSFFHPATSDCRMMKDLTSTATPLTLGKVDSQWTSSSKHCSKVAQHFESEHIISGLLKYFNKLIVYIFFKGSPRRESITVSFAQAINPPPL